jgi:hypothetical protein
MTFIETLDKKRESGSAVRTKVDIYLCAGAIKRTSEKCCLFDTIEKNSEESYLPFHYILHLLFLTVC